MAKKSMIQREEKRNRLSIKYALKRESLKDELKVTSDYQSKISIYKKLGKLPKNSAPSRKRNRLLGHWSKPEHFIEILDYQDMSLEKWHTKD
jgi:small subunit ribosomal protein S14